MTKKIAVINDLSGFGRCSLTAAISTISAMGVQPCPLPTAILSAQTEYPSYYLADCTDKMEHFRTEWEKMGQTFDGIYTGFVANEEQIAQIFKFIDTFYTSDTFLLVDPVMGDDGTKYDTFTPALLREMKRLTKHADIITPNVTELCLLSDTDFETLHRFSKDPDSKEKLLEQLKKTARSLCQDGPRHVVITGIHFKNTDDSAQVGNLYVSEKETFFSYFPHISKSYSGTGDLFASCLAAGIARGSSIPDTIQLAGHFLESAIADSANNRVPPNDGVNYEKFLSMIM